jgi:hypothetical protein
MAARIELSSKPDGSPECSDAGYWVLPYGCHYQARVTRLAPSAPSESPNPKSPFPPFPDAAGKRGGKRGFPIRKR